MSDDLRNERDIDPDGDAEMAIHLLDTASGSKASALQWAIDWWMTQAECRYDRHDWSDSLVRNLPTGLDLLPEPLGNLRGDLSVAAALGIGGGLVAQLDYHPEPPSLDPDRLEPAVFEDLPHGLRHIESSETGDYFEMTLPSADDQGRPYRVSGDDD